MFLSNLRKSFLPAGLCVIILQGCGSTQTNENVAAAPLAERKSGFPFSTKEAEVYQGDIVINGREADRTVVARKAERWREDQFRGGTLWLTELYTDKRYSIDHSRKIYIEEQVNENGIESFERMPLDIFRGTDLYEFDEIGREGTLIKYKVRPNKYMSDEVLIDVDTTSGMIVRHEFKSAEPEQGGFVYEVRNLKLNVDDCVFALPAGFRKVSPDEFHAERDKKP